MAIYITGDTHGGFQRFGSKYFPQQKNMGREDYVIITGDFGGLWDGSNKDRYWLDWLEQRPFTTLFVDGNHENFRRLDTFPSRIWHGGSIHQIRPHVLHLMRGQLYEISGKTFFTMGGAKSHDVEDGILDPADPNFHAQQSALKRSGRNRFRVLGRSWWPEELPSDEEYHTALKTLERTNWQVDYVITHCASTSIALSMNRHNEADHLTEFLEMVDRRLEYEYWFFGHFHDNRSVDQKHILLWEQIVQIL